MTGYVRGIGISRHWRRNTALFHSDWRIACEIARSSFWASTKYRRIFSLFFRLPSLLFHFPLLPLPLSPQVASHALLVVGDLTLIKGQRPLHPTISQAVSLVIASRITTLSLLYLYAYKIYCRVRGIRLHLVNS